MYSNEYNRKRMQPEEAVSLIQSGQHVVLGGGPIEPMTFVEKMTALKGKVKDVKVTNILSLKAHEIMTSPAYKETFDFESSFYGPVQRATDKLGMGSYAPAHLRNIGSNILTHHGEPDVYVCTVSPMDKNGFFTTGPGVIYDYEMIHNAKTIIFEVNAQHPRTFGDTVFHISQVDHLYEVDMAVPTIPDAPITDTDRMIGQYVSELIEDGSTIQLGIGAIPNAAAKELINKKDLGIHTEMLNDAMVDLYNAGVITGRKKTLFPNKIVTSFSLGTKKVYDFIDDNPVVMHYRTSYTNDPFVVSQNHKMVSVNTTLMVDFTGQCASEAIRNTQISGTGGQVETAIGAQMARGGKSIITLHSTTEIKKPGTDERERVSKIVPYFDRGTLITLARTDVEYVVTEYGIARLKGASVKDRTKMLIKIAHPDYRDELTEEAKKHKFI